MSEKMLEVCLEDYFNNDVEPSKEIEIIEKKLNAILRENVSEKIFAEADDLTGKIAYEHREKGFKDGFKYAIEFFGILKGGAVA